jgi:dienelactone hydrolase
MKDHLSWKLIILVTLLIHWLIIPGQPAQAKGPPVPDLNLPGPFSVGHTSFILVDDARQTVDYITYPNPPFVEISRPIPVHLFYPADLGSSPTPAIYPLDQIHFAFPPFLTSSTEWEAQGIDPAFQEPAASAEGPFPLVLFSQGWGGPALSSLYIGTRLASHGFVVALIYHYGDGVMPYEPFDNLAVAAMNRPLDVSFTLTRLLERNETTGDLIYQLIDPEKVAASGWSLGGYAAMALAAGDDLVCDKAIELGYIEEPDSTCVASPSDERISAIISLDGTTPLLYFDELARITVPTLGIGQEWSTLASTLPPPWESIQARLHAASQGHPAYRIDLQGALHQTFSNMCEALPLLDSRGLIGTFFPGTYEEWEAAYCGAPLPTGEAHRIVTKYMIAFLKKNLAGESGYQPILTPGQASIDESMVEFFVTEKRNPYATDEDWPGTYMYFMHQPGSEQAKADKNPTQTLPVSYIGFGGEER